MCSCWRLFINVYVDIFRRETYRTFRLVVYAETIRVRVVCMVLRKQELKTFTFDYNATGMNGVVWVKPNCKCIRMCVHAIYVCTRYATPKFATYYLRTSPEDCSAVKAMNRRNIDMLSEKFVLAEYVRLKEFFSFLWMVLLVHILLCRGCASCNENGSRLPFGNLCRKHTMIESITLFLRYERLKFLLRWNAKD